MTYWITFTKSDDIGRYQTEFVYQTKDEGFAEEFCQMRNDALAERGLPSDLAWWDYTT